jgi:biopolymer transport protein ExbB
MLDLFVKGGILMYPILLCSIVALGIVIERSVRYFQIKKSGSIYALLKLKKLVSNGDIERAKAETSRSFCPLIRELGHCLSNAPNRVTMEKILFHFGHKEVRKMEKNLPTLATIANISPLLGLLGTVMGMIKAFMVIEKMGNQVNAGLLAGGIWEAMLTTAFGLTVAIPTLMLYSYFTNRANNYATDLEDCLNGILNLLEKQRFFQNDSF